MLSKAIGFLKMTGTPQNGSKIGITQHNKKERL